MLPSTVTQTESPVRIHNILFATDLTLASHKAFRYAKACARHFHANLMPAHVMHASAHDWPKFGSDPDYEQRWQESRRELDAICHELSEADIKAEPVLLEGDPAEDILKAIENKRADLLVLGTHGSRDLERLFLGSTAEAIFRHASCPVLTVGPHVPDPHQEDVRFSRIVLATDFSPEAAAAVPYAFSLAAEDAAHITICHVLPEGHAKTMDSAHLQAEFLHATSKLVPETTWKKCAADCVVEYGNAADEILKLAEEQQADLIVLGVRSFSAISTHLLPGVAFKVVSGASCPVLTVRK